MPQHLVRVAFESEFEQAELTKCLATIWYVLEA